MHRPLLTFILIFFVVSLFGQMKPRLERPVGSDSVDPRALSPVLPLGPVIAPSTAPFDEGAPRFRALPALPKPVKDAKCLVAERQAIVLAQAKRHATHAANVIV